MLQVKPHVVPLHVEVPFAGGTHGVHDVVPQLIVLVFITHVPPHKCCPAGHVGTHIPPDGAKPGLQVNPHVVPSHVAVPFMGAVHGIHDVVPQLIVLVFDTHVAPHRCVPTAQTQVDPEATNPALQVNPHVVPLHVAVPFAGAMHGVHEVAPQLIVLVFATHIAPHKCCPAGH